MIRIFKRLIAWLLEKIASKIEVPSKPESGYFNKANDETLQEAIKNLLTRTANSLRNPKPKASKQDAANGIEELTGNSDNSEKIEEIAPQSFFSSQKENYHNLLKRIKSLPRWFKLVAGTSIPVCVVYIILYFILVTPPETNSEDLFRYNKGKPLVRIGYVQEWPTSVVMTSLLSELMDANLNVDISAKAISQNRLTDLWNMLITDKADITPSVWLPRTHQGFIIDAEDEVTILNTWLTGAKLGLAVPAYMKINSIEDLKNYSGKRIIYGIDPYSKLHSMTKKALELYGLKNYRIIAKSDKFMLSKFEEALSQKKEIIIAIWIPHWIFGEWQVKMLDDPLQVYGTPENINIIATEEFSENFPDICKFLSRIKLNVQDLSDLMSSARKMNSPGTAASKWIQANKEKVKEWTEEEESF